LVLKKGRIDREVQDGEGGRRRRNYTKRVTTEAVGRDIVKFYELPGDLEGKKKGNPTSLDRGRGGEHAT